MGRNHVRTWWLTEIVMVMMVIAATVSSPSPQAVAETKRAHHRKKARNAPSNRIRPIENTPLDVRDDDPNREATLAANFLTQFGYFRQGKPLDFLASPPAGSDPNQQGNQQTRAIRLFQSYFGLKQTGKLDAPTLQLMSKERCGVADIPPEEEDQESQGSNGQSPSRYVLLGTKWDKNILTWKLDTSSTRQLSASTQRRVLKDAFETWRKVAPLDFTERSRGRVDIDIKFGSGSHGDDYPFDGEGKILAHAFGPGQGDIDGDMHIDDAEDWTSATHKDISDLYLVATHELGHSLGLSHSRDPGALMYPYYGLTDRLGPDDIKAIQSLYGIRIGKPTTRAPVTRAPRPTTTTTTRRPITRAPYTRRPTRTERPPRPQTTTTLRPAICDAQFDVVIQDPQQRSIFTGIQGDTVYRFNAYGVLPNFPSHLNSVFPGAPSHAEAVFTVAEKFTTYFVKDNRVWRYHGSRLDADYPKDLDPTHFPEVIRFILPIVDSGGYRRIFVFGTTLWWEYDFDDVPGSYFRPRPNLIPQYWPAISSDVSYAVMGPDNYVYLVTPDSYVMLDSFRRTVHGGKQEGRPQWMSSVCHRRMAIDSGASSMKKSGLVWMAATLSLLLSITIKC